MALKAYRKLPDYLWMDRWSLTLEQKKMVAKMEKMIDGHDVAALLLNRSILETYTCWGIKPSEMSQGFWKLVGRKRLEAFIRANHPHKLVDTDIYRLPAEDHSYLWNKDGRPAMFEFHPYHLQETCADMFGSMGVRDVIDYYHKVGEYFNLSVDIDTYSHHYPTRTYSVRFWRKSMKEACRKTAAEEYERRKAANVR